MRRGLVFGKFHPPHRGHKYLIDEAAARCDTLTVLLMASERESIPCDLRLAWLREMHPRTDIRLVPDEMPTAWSLEREDLWEAFSTLVRSAHPEPIDRLFTSEWYGERTAQALHCEHVAIDPMRRTFSVSSSLVRANPTTYLDLLAPSVRAWIVPRIVIVGAESTGKTTLAQALTAHFSTVWVSEFGREYTRWVGQTQTIPYRWTNEDFVVIAAEQQAREDTAARAAAPVLICDTDAFATDLWRRRYLDVRDGVVPHDLPGRRFYLLTRNDVPFVQDGSRDGEHRRTEMTAWFASAFAVSNTDVNIVEGPYEGRLAQAITAVERARSAVIPLER